VICYAIANKYKYILDVQTIDTLIVKKVDI